jgi:hypothetical protein
LLVAALNAVVRDGENERRLLGCLAKRMLATKPLHQQSRRTPMER